MDMVLGLPLNFYQTRHTAYIERAQAARLLQEYYIRFDRVLQVFWRKGRIFRILLKIVKNGRFVRPFCSLGI